MIDPDDHHLFLVEDEPDVASFVRQGLEEEGYEVSWEETGQRGLEYIQQVDIDLVLLDIRLPDLSGLEVCERLRLHRPELPVIMLTALRGHVELALRRERDADSYRETLCLLDRKLGGLVQSLRALLTLTRLDRAGRLEREPVDLAADEAESFRDAAADTGVDLAVTADGDPCVRGQPALLRKAVRNLIDNAVKYTPEGRVEVAVRPTDDGRVALDCVDTGVGMTAEERAEARGRFYRGGESAQMADGSGLGLSLVDRIVDKHGGTLHLDAAPGGGTRATVVLPAASSPDSAAPSVAPSERPESSPVVS